MNQNPILRVLSSFRKFDVQALLMGGQACILYGAAEFSRDTDFVVLCSAANLERLQQALDDLRADPVFLPPLEPQYLRKGHACHFRCGVPEARDLRVDVMSTMRGCDDFPALWERRETLHLAGGLDIAVLSLHDLVRAKKTQRDKDWPMIRRLVEADYVRHATRAAPSDVHFWLRESRTAAMLLELAATHRAPAADMSTERPLLRHAVQGNAAGVEEALIAEERRERILDREYWAPLRRELEHLRRRKGLT